MRIEKIRIVNLNSLYGVHEIDLTVSAYHENNLFIIWGDMGSGKTTVLDAITLALYGRTSRLSKVTKNSNEIMSKGTKHCSAEVTFYLNGSRYRARWAQELNRNGNLSDQMRELCILNPQGEGDIVIENRNNSIDTAVKDLIKLDYSEFTKAVVLEQGKFAEFLNADDKERAKILEQLTSTNIYSKLSMMAYTKEKDERYKLDLAKKNIDNLSLLSPEQVSELKEKECLLKNDKNLLNDEIARLDAAIAWLKDVENATNRILELNRSYQDYEKDNLAFESSRKILERGLSASKIYYLYENYIKDKNKLEAEITVLKSIQEQLPVLKNEINESNEHVKSCENELLSLKTKLEENEPIFKHVRQLQAELKVFSEERDRINHDHHKTKDEYQKTSDNLKSLQDSVSELKNRLDENEIYFTNHASEENLIEEFEGIKSRLTQVKQSEEMLSKAMDSLSEAVRLVNQSQIEADDLEARMIAEEASYIQIKAIAENSKKSYEQACDGHHLDDLIELRDRYMREKHSALIIASYEQQRLSLCDGHPCPLCGSTVHPYCTETPQLSEIDQRIQALDDQIHSIRQAKSLMEKDDETERLKRSDIDKLRNSLTSLQSVLSNLNLSVDEKRQSLSHFQEIYHTALLEFNHIVEKYSESAEDSAQAGEICHRLEQRLASWKDHVASREQLQKELMENQNIILMHQTALNSLSNRLNEIKAALDNNTSQSSALQSEIDSIFGNRHVDEEERLLKTSISNAEKHLKSITDAHSVAHTRFETLKTSLNEHQNHVQLCTESLDLSQKSFECALIENKFSDEKEFLSTYLPETQLKVLQERAENLNKLGHELESRILEAKAQLSKLKDLSMTDRPIEELKTERNEKKLKLNDCLKEIGIIQRRIEEQDEKSKQLCDFIEQFRLMEKEYLQWKKLSDLIGSSEGDKFRKFAQGMTFNILLNHANLYLQEKKLMPRYELVRREEADQGLDFMVHDYQTGEIRPASNLSGGEKFCMCLALALGLSEMASKNVIIDSLFIDEGLGTLDDQTLDSALMMLRNLSDSRRDRLVGLITHISRAREMVTTQIVAEKQGAGRSTLTGPGCSYQKLPSDIIKKQKKSKKKAK